MYINIYSIYISLCKWCLILEAQFRVDANISLHVDGISGKRTELKNISNLYHLFDAICCEIERQIMVMREGGTIIEETRNTDDRGYIKSITLHYNICVIVILQN